ncbi:P-loop ATPase, Sll1717 family [Vibrio metoecus]|uniref:P-loop ATPase, Sll1717 family n=1 Tax=Vibrio metoecus TaxID=1481663 RepID=UPI000BA93EC1|nr:hypothetical protein [Vibrio metoecus]PAR26402.1 hypothetical protein CGU00_18985 [Vibrio metoecus]PAR59688.1 hypothetical protein CGT90_18985 [Vibrio metoecus]
MSLLEEISNWKLDAKFEESGRYFYHTKNLKEIESGSISFIIGRKGCGKTAISENLYNKVSYDSYAEKLTFKNFPFNELYQLSNKEYTQPNQYISIWKYLIYSSICKMFIRNQAIDNELVSTLEKIHGKNQGITNLQRMIKKLVGKEWSIKILGFGGKVTLSDADTSQSWIEKVDILEDIISEHIDNSNYYILFDELDEDYSGIIERGAQSNYLSLLTSLFKAVQDVKSIFPNTGIKPVVFLRDDIYDLLVDSDKTKWDDFKLELDWNIDSIKDLLAFRLTRAKDPDAKQSIPFHKIWPEICYSQTIKYGNRQQKELPSFEYIAKSTHLRPRDFIKYIQSCAKETIEYSKKDKFNASTIKKVDKAFSNYLRSELSDEINGIMPDVKEVFALISEIRKWNFTIDEFKQAHSKALAQGVVRTKNPDLILKTLFHFSAIGNQPKQKQVEYFRYNNKEARINFNENIVVHRGLLKSLQIL